MSPPTSVSAARNDLAAVLEKEMKRLLACIALTLVMGLPVAAFAQPPLPRDSTYQLDAPMTDQSGRGTTLADRRGRVQLVSMFYTSCRYICH